jgi:acid phosphatase
MRTPMDNWTPADVSGTWLCDDPNAQSPRMHVSTVDGVRRRYSRVLDSKYATFRPNCENGELIIQGMDQHRELGNFYRKWLVNDTKFLNPWFDKTQVSIRASKVERCQRSAVSFMNGFYPPAKPGEKVDFVTGSDYREYLWPAPGGCKDMQDMWNDFVATDEFKARKENAMKLYADIYKNISLTPSEDNWMFIGDWISSYLCTNQEVPLVTLTDEIITQGLKDIAYYSYGYFGTHRAYAASAIWRAIFRDIDDYLGKKATSTKFRLYSAHDTTIIALLVSLGFKDEALPPFRSHFAIELWRKNGKYILRNVFNGEPVSIDFMDGKKEVEYQKLKETMASRGDLNYCLSEFPAK